MTDDFVHPYLAPFPTDPPVSSDVGRLQGRTGQKPARLFARVDAEMGRIRFDDAGNPEFWLEATVPAVKRAAKLEAENDLLKKRLRAASKLKDRVNECHQLVGRRAPKLCVRRDCFAFTDEKEPEDWTLCKCCGLWVCMVHKTRTCEDEKEEVDGEDM